MTKRDYTILLEGVEALDLPLSVLRDLCDLLTEGSVRSARLLAEGRSVTRGAVPAWVSAAADVRVSKFAAGSLDLGVTAQRLVDVAPDLFAQQSLFPTGADPDATAFDLFLDAARDAAAGSRDSDRLDAGILEVLGRSSSLFSAGATRLSISGRGTTRAVLDPASVVLIRTLADETPAPRISRVRGVLDTLTVSTQTLALRLQDGRVLRGFAGTLGMEVLKPLLGFEVVLEGFTSFRPSGEAQRIEVESAVRAAPGDVIWARLPRVEPVSSRPRPALLAGTTTGLDAFFGAWPGDETDEALATAMKQSA